MTRVVLAAVVLGVVNALLAATLLVRSGPPLDGGWFAYAPAATGGVSWGVPWHSVALAVAVLVVVDATLAALAVRLGWLGREGRDG